jgi:formylglycine-generating enzyme required for sulfatase activity
MFCATCNLDYPDHINFCRRCGRALVRTGSGSLMESLCCTRCGSRVVRGENFCQQCGHRLKSSMPETVVGACYHCGVSWRNEWLYCKNCGLDRDRALMPPVSTPASTVSSSANQSNVAVTLEEIPKANTQRCRKCGAEAKPYSRFCETCGFNFVSPPSGTPNVSSARNQLQGEAGSSWPMIESPEALVDLEPAEIDLPDNQVAFSEESEQRNTRAAVQTLAIIAGLLLLGGVVFVLWYIRAGSENADPSQVNTRALPRLSPTPTPAPIPTGEGMIYIEGGQFLMGRDNGDRFETPRFKAVVSPFLIDRTEVTNEEYVKFVKATGRRPPRHWIGGNYRPTDAKLPVIFVSWNDANDYATWAKKRLPTEIEWEFAARGTDGRLYPWGNEWKAENANAERGGAGTISEVGRFNAGASPFGVLDMSGNVWEWTSGGLFSYLDKNILLTGGKVIRGGAYDAPRQSATTTYRGVVPANRIFPKTGFRCARDVR